MTADNRSFSRVEFETKGTLGNSESLWEVLVLDISLNGLLIKRPDYWDAALGDEFDFDMLLSETGDSFIVMRCKVAWVSDQRVGLERTDIDVDSITHLRKILELNTGEPERVHREFSKLGAI